MSNEGARGAKGRDAQELLKRAVRDDSQLFTGVVAWQSDVNGWRRSSRETLAETPGRVVRRTVWDAPQGPDTRVVIDVVECASAHEALLALVDRLEWNELARLPDGPRDLGVASFVHPPEVPPAVFFARANLCICVVSFARRPVAVVPIAQRLERRLVAPPTVGEARVLVEPVPRRKADAGVAFALLVAMPFPLVEDGYRRFTAEGASLEIRDGEVMATPTVGVSARVDVFVIEPGREPVTGTVVIPRR
jgi:hypothetical protein